MFNSNDLVKEMDGLRKFALKLTGDESDAEDLLQSTVTRALEKKHLFEEGTNLFKWTSKMMFNIFASNYRRKAKFESQYDPEPVIDKQSQPTDQYKQTQLREVSEAMDGMSGDHRDILMAVCVDGRKYEAVADEFDIPVGTVRSRISRAREKLQDDLEQQSPAHAA